MPADPLSPQRLVERFRCALAAHNLTDIADCLHPDYRSLHSDNPEQIVNGRAAALAGWKAIFAAVPDLRAELRGCTVNNDTARTVWHWHGQTVDGFPYESNSVMIFTIRAGQIMSAEISASPAYTEGPDWDTVIGNLLDPTGDEPH